MIEIKELHTEKYIFISAFTIVCKIALSLTYFYTMVIVSRNDELYADQETTELINDDYEAI
jgi:hypothetical protein